jgi:hypothetical protein
MTPINSELRSSACTATLAQSAPVLETFEGKPVWEGVVHVFDLAGHPTATRVYAWSSPIEVARSGGSSRCCIRRQSIARKLRCGRRSLSNAKRKTWGNENGMRFR